MTGIDYFILSYFVAVNSYYAVLLLLGMLEIRRRESTRLPEFDTTVFSEAQTPPVSVLVAAYNEEGTIRQSVRAFLQLEYPEHHVIVINDGSTDDTLDILREEFDLAPFDLVVREAVESERVRGIYRSRRDERLWVVDKVNGGKADALNAGLNVCRTPLACSVDADTIVEPRALLRMVEPFLYDPDGVIAVGGTVRLANGCKIEDGVCREVGLPDSWLARFQMIEYLRAFLFGRLGLNRLGGNLIISGAFGMFDRHAALDVGGYSADTVGEDMELVIRLQKRARSEDPPRRIVQIPDPICYTEVPETLGGLGNQRDRWHRGLADSLWRHKDMCLNPKYGALGMVVYPLFLFFELLGPLIELFGYGYFLVVALMGYVSWQFAALFLAVAIVWGALLSSLGLLLDWWGFDILRGGKVRRRLTLTAILENLGYRQLTLFFRLRGMIGFLLGRKAWGSAERRDFQYDDTAPAALEEETAPAAFEEDIAPVPIKEAS